MEKKTSKDHRFVQTTQGQIKDKKYRKRQTRANTDNYNFVVHPAVPSSQSFNCFFLQSHQPINTCGKEVFLKILNDLM
jgi:hypothetical protein